MTRINSEKTATESASETITDVFESAAQTSETTLETAAASSESSQVTIQNATGNSMDSVKAHSAANVHSAAPVDTASISTDTLTDAASSDTDLTSNESAPAALTRIRSQAPNNELNDRTLTPPLAQTECARQVPLEQRIGQLMFPLLTQSEFAQAQQLVASGLIGGIVVLGSPDTSIRDDIARFQKVSMFGPGIIAVDEEGGRVQRLSRITSRVPSARKVALTLGTNQARELAAKHAAEIGQLGFTMNLAPVADLNYSQAIGDRSFGRDAFTVSAFAMATADGIIDAGLVPVLKHFPGHGRGSDSHIGLPVIPSVQVLRQQDLIPFIEASKRKDIPIMIGHLVVEGLTDGQPASVSDAAVNGLLRNDLGFDGLVITDAFNMDAISASLTDAEATELSLLAGVDLVMLSSLADVHAAVERVMESVQENRIAEESITESFLRVMHTRTINVCDL